MTLFSLMANEIMKINSKRQSWNFFVFLFVAVLAIGLTVALFITQLAESIGYRSFTGFMITGLEFFILIFAVVIGAQIFTDEYKDGTIKQLLIRPASRSAVLLSKYLTILLMMLLAYAVLIVSAIVIGLVLFGNNPSDALSLGQLLKSVLYSLPGTIFIMTVSFFLGVVIKSLGLAISIAVVANFGGTLITSFLGRYSWSKYIVFANLNMSVYDKDPAVSGGGSPFMPGMTFGFSLTVVLLYILALYLLANLIFAKRDIQ
ncbi:ABC transporter permease [Paenibacillus senegalensis]|uniref:ABC transporter permease n=1 Tax=Paenibacillus senegalensis TaxID=1465766 RepID=UPI0002896D00|nr:ABC transporter permease [Paenibacillus senegalensis]